ncbi:MAG TPA: DUF6776 family protein [Burkholderiaceae bacterium]|nr:DUF6776 family protein [Burkholderiaceae bacterium]
MKENVKPHWGRGIALLLLVAGLVAGGIAGRYWPDDDTRQQYLAAQTRLQAGLDQARADLARTQAELDATHGLLTLETSTRKALEATLHDTQLELGKARDQLAFFDQLLPPGPKGAISIRALEIERLGPNLQYRTLLMRNGPDAEPFSGTMQFTAKGLQDGKAAKIELHAARAPGLATVGGVPSGDGLVLSFDQYQRSGGLLSVPEGFEPQTVTLNVLEGNSVRVSRTVNLSAAE